MEDLNSLLLSTVYPATVWERLQEVRLRNSKLGGPPDKCQHCLAGLALNLADDADAREAWLGKIASGETVATVAFGGNWLPDSWAVTVAGGKASGVAAVNPMEELQRCFVSSN